MLEIVNITPEFAIGPQISPKDFAALRRAGFMAIINVRPDGEAGTYIGSDEAYRLAHAEGLIYAHCPTENHAILEPEVIDQFERALAKLPKPVFSHCKSGTRAAILWALVASRHRDVKDVITALRAAGQQLDFLEDELHESAKEVRRSPFQLRADPLLGPGRTGSLGKDGEEPDNE